MRNLLLALGLGVLFAAPVLAQKGAINNAAKPATTLQEQYLPIRYGDNMASSIGKKVSMNASKAQHIGAHPMFGGPNMETIYLSFNGNNYSQMVGYYDPKQVRLPNATELVVFGTLKGESMSRGGSTWTEYYILIDRVEALPGGKAASQAKGAVNNTKGAINTKGGGITTKGGN